MFESSDEKYLIRALSQNRAVLFLGAGFSQAAGNQLGDKIPSGLQLSKLIWEFLGYDGDYDSTPLSEMYEALLASGKSYPEIQNFLEKLLLSGEIPNEYSSLTLPYWYRIYTTNIDDVVAQVYRTAKLIRLDILSFPGIDILERDQSLERIQLLYLNGRLPCPPDKITFSTTQYARGAIEDLPLYEQFVRDYSTLPVVFVGTQLNEPLLWQYIEARQKRRADVPEHRPKSFLIAPKISQPKKAQLELYNIVPVEATAFEFLDWLKGIAPSLPTKLDVIKAAAPGLGEIIEQISAAGKDLRDVKLFGEFFDKVPSKIDLKGDRSLYLMGASPRWEDLFRGLDAPRNITDEIFQYTSEAYKGNKAVHLVAILGSAGCGKSTILRRLGIKLAQAGRPAYFTRSEQIPSPQVIRGSLEAIEDRCILLFDNSEVILSALPGVVNEVAKLENPPIVVIASRTNDFDRLWGRFKDNIEIKEIHVPHLDREEIKEVIRVLEENNLLGKLQGLTQNDRIKEIEDRSHKQILVAMREATSGRGFDEIIEDEFQNLAPEETKLLYLCVALATEAGYSIDKGEFVRCSLLPPAEALEFLTRNLRDIVIPYGQQGNGLRLRHQQIAEYAVEQFAPRTLLSNAYVRILSVLATEIAGKHWRSRVFSVYRDIINHLNIYNRFANKIDEARHIYASLSKYLQSDSQFWLQWGSLELESGNLDYAENYLAQAESLDNENAYVKNAKAHLLLKKGIDASTAPAALTFRDEGSKILEARLAETDYDDAYAVHIYCYYRYQWMRRWNYFEDEIQRLELEKLRIVSQRGLESHPRHIRLKQVKEGVEKAYFQLALPRDKRSTDSTM